MLDALVPGGVFFHTDFVPNLGVCSGGSSVKCDLYGEFDASPRRACRTSGQHVFWGVVLRPEAKRENPEVLRFEGLPSFSSIGPEDPMNFAYLRRGGYIDSLIANGRPTLSSS